MGEPQAYAKLWGRIENKEFAAYITALPAHLGRSRKGPAEPNFIDLGASSILSRTHATIDWVADKKHYTIVCEGKNGMTVNKKHYGQGGKVELRSRTPIRLGHCMLYFLLPEETPAHPSPMDVGPEKDEPDGAETDLEDN